LWYFETNKIIYFVIFAVAFLHKKIPNGTRNNFLIIACMYTKTGFSESLFSSTFIVLKMINKIKESKENTKKNRLKFC